MEVHRPTAPTGPHPLLPGKLPLLLRDLPFLCLGESPPQRALAQTERTDFSLSVRVFPLPKSNTSAEEHRFSRGKTFVHLLFSFAPSALYPALKLGSSRQQLRRTCETSPTGEPGTGSCHLSKWTKDAGSAWQGSLARDRLSQWGTAVMKPALRAVPVCRLFVPQCCSFQGYRAVWNRTRLKGTAKRGARLAAAAAAGALRKHPRLCFLGGKRHASNSAPAKVKRPGMPGLSLKCLFLIKGSGTICLDRLDCTTA